MPVSRETTPIFGWSSMCNNITNAAIRAYSGKEAKNYQNTNIHD
jgi:hypothetical protein